MKINQYCSVCKKQLDMEVIPTDDGGDDGVIWLRCPECQGFLPKFTGEGLGASRPDASGQDVSGQDGSGTGVSGDDASTKGAPSTGTTPAADSSRGPTPAGTAPDPRPDALDESLDDALTVPPVDVTTDGAGDDDKAKDEAEEAEPIAEYAARLAEADLETARPYRPTSSFRVGDVVHHLAYDDMGVVVAEETLPGGRTVAKVYFEKAGIVRLIARPADPS